MSLPLGLQRHHDQADTLRRLLEGVTDSLIQQHWQLAAAYVREVMPDATGLRLHGDDTDNGLRLGVTEVLVDGRPVTVEPARLDELHKGLDESLLFIAEHEAEELLRGQRDHDLPAPWMAGQPATVRLADGELRIFAPDPDEGDRGRMWVLDVLGVSTLIRERDDGVYVHLDGDATSEPVATTLLVEVNNGGEQQHSL